MHIKDGNITSDNGYAILEYKADEEAASALNTTEGLVIDDGTFKSASGKDTVKINGIDTTSSQSAVQIKGGEYSKLPDDKLLTEGSTAKVISTSSSSSGNKKDPEEKGEDKEDNKAPEAGTTTDAKNPDTADNFIVFISFVITGLVGFALAARSILKN